MAELLLSIRELVARKNDLVYAAKSAASVLSGGKHFPEMLDSDVDANVALLLSAIALADQPFTPAVSEAA